MDNMIEPEWQDQPRQFTGRPSTVGSFSASKNHSNQLVAENHNFDWYVAHRVLFRQGLEYRKDILEKRGDVLVNS